jgi:hypothetical protein
MQITGITDVRNLVQDRLSALTNFCSKKVSTLATDADQLIRDYDIETNTKERTTLLLLLHIPQKVLEQSLDESLTGRSPSEIVNEITRRVWVTEGDPGRLDDTFRDYHGLIQFKYQQGDPGRSHSQQSTTTVMHMHAYLDFCRDKTYLNYGMTAHGPSTDVMDPLQRPQKQYFDLTVDNRVLSDTRLEGHGHIKSPSPYPSHLIMNPGRGGGSTTHKRGTIGKDVSEREEL